VTLRELADRWRQEAALFERRGQGDAARLLASIVQEFERHLTQWELEALPVSAAAQETGYSAAQLRRLFPGQQRIARKDLPKKPGRPGPRRPQAA
jgi:hypothetical protein